jgi:HJR/Mrr/RecB family endonuclease
MIILANMKNEEIYITNSEGQSIQFSEDRLRSSLMKAGASLFFANEITEEIKRELKNGLPKYQVFQHAFKLLKKKEKLSAARYKLKQGILELGPAGFAFEQFIAELFKSKGYHVKVGQYVEGKCVSHEIDVIASNNQETILIECKYHNRLDLKCDVKVPLYIHSRFNDIKNKGFYKDFKGYIFTNTSFSDDARSYAICSDINIVDWNSDKKNSLKDMIYEHDLFPITCLLSISKEEKAIFLNQNIVLVKQLQKEPALLERNIRNSNRIKNILSEINQLCK